MIISKIKNFHVIKFCDDIGASVATFMFDCVEFTDGDAQLICHGVYTGILYDEHAKQLKEYWEQQK